MQQFEIDETLVEKKKKAKKENNKKKISYTLITIISFICILLLFIVIYNKNLKLLHKEKEKNEDLKEIVDDLLKEKNDTKNIIDELIKWKKENEKTKEEDEDDFIDYDIDSILLNNKDIQLISKRLIKEENDKVIYNLIYRASRDGKNATSYHKKCNGKNNTLTVVQTVKGNKFGGFTETEIQDGYIGYKDPNSFIFSLDKMKIYENLNKEGVVIRHYSGYGPYFIGGFVVFDSNFYNVYNNYVYDKSSSSNFFSKEDGDFELNHGEELFAVREVEVFEISFE